MAMPVRPAWASDRREVIERPKDAKVTLLVPGVELCPLVGSHNGGRGLFTGLLTLAPKAIYPVHTRPFAEVLVPIEGNVAVDVENRRYRPGLVDAIILPARVSRQVVNLSASQPAVIHTAMSSSTPAQTWVNSRFTPVDQPAGATGHPGVERLCRNRAADRFELAPLRSFKTFTTRSSVRRGSVAVTAFLNPVRAFPAIAMSLMNRSRSFKEQQLASSRDSVTSSPVTRLRSCPRDDVTTSST